MKETIPSSSITWSEMGKQNVQLIIEETEILTDTTVSTTAQLFSSNHFCNSPKVVCKLGKNIQGLNGIPSVVAWPCCGQIIGITSGIFPFHFN